MKNRGIKTAKSTNHYVYRVFYGDEIVYVGRTNQSLSTRLRGHFFALPMHRIIDIEAVSKIEYASFKTIADMYLYEVYYINAYHPALNRDDRASDFLTVSLPDVNWIEYCPPLMEKWKIQVNERDILAREKRRLKIEQQMMEREKRREKFESGSKV